VHSHMAGLVRNSHIAGMDTKERRPHRTSQWPCKLLQQLHIVGRQHHCIAHNCQHGRARPNDCQALLKMHCIAQESHSKTAQDTLEPAGDTQMPCSTGPTAVHQQPEASLATWKKASRQCGCVWAWPGLPSAGVVVLCCTTGRRGTVDANQQQPRISAETKNNKKAPARLKEGPRDNIQHIH